MRFGNGTVANDVEAPVAFNVAFEIIAEILF
jgi:hypothetical protein